MSPGGIPRAPELAIRTPEHVAVHFNVADIGSRAVAVILDVGLQLLAVFALIWGMATLFFWGGDVTVALVLVAFFLVRNFYFTFFELRWQGRTPGKRVLGLRVVARDGGPLSADLVFARNLTRELETFLPLSALLAPRELLAGAPAWANLATFLWIVALTLLPVFNRQRARLGDLLAGTVVVLEPKAKLLDDLVETTRRLEADTEYTFTTEELDIYGIRELQVLEEVLRRPHYDEEYRILLTQVTRKILRKIGRDPEERVDPNRFLRSFYAAQRARLEGRMLLGHRRERKVR
jgi:uncharacterized RDD family membrane protein YckC